MSHSDNLSESKSSLQNLLRTLPGVDVVLEQTAVDPALSDVPRSVLLNSIRNAIGFLRDAIRNDPDSFSINDVTISTIADRVKILVKAAMTENLVTVVNATGVVIHTNLGRSLLAPDAVRHLIEVATRYSNLEFNLATGKRGSRYSAVEEIICEISGAESAIVVNNNAAAVLLALDTVAKDREVIVSRGELVEIGGSFRIPDVMAKSGGILKEVGTTNRTHRVDYERAITENTGLLLKVHTSNYAIVGFTAGVSLTEMVELGAKHHLPVMEDLGSGTFIDFKSYGLMKEPTVQESVTAGVDIITFSGDKLLGGPQGGIIIGKRDRIDQIKKNPLTRALRIDKLTLAALESTLRLYRDEAKAVANIPTLYMMTCPFQEIEKKATHLIERLKTIQDTRFSVDVMESVSKVGGGSLPLLELPTRCVGIRIKDMSAARIDAQLRKQSPPVIGRIGDEIFLMDMRTVMPDEIDILFRAIHQLLTRE